MGHSVSAESIQRMRDKIKGRKQSEETKKKISEHGNRNTVSVPLMCVETGE